MISIGITYLDGRLLVTVDGHTLVSTLAGGSHTFPVPPHTQYADIEVLSGAVMSGAQVLCHQDFDGKYRWLHLIIPACSSGVNVGANYYNSSGQLIPLPSMS